MGAKTQEDVIRFYDELRRTPGWEFLQAMSVFLPRLFRSRDLSGCTLFTSHATLCIVRQPTYPEWLDQPVLMVNCTAIDRLQLDFRVTLATEPVVRTITESS